MWFYTDEYFVREKYSGTLSIAKLRRLSVILSRSDVVCLIVGGINWLASDDNILLSVNLHGLLFDQDGLLDHARLGLLSIRQLNLLLGHGGVHLLTRLLGLLRLLRLLGLLRLLRLGGLDSLLFVVLDLLFLAIDNDLTDHDIDEQYNQEPECGNADGDDQKSITVCLLVIHLATVIVSGTRSDHDDIKD